MSLSHGLPQRDDWRSAIEELRGAYADKTIKEWRKSFRLFELWSGERGETPLPATPATVAAYVATLFPRYCPRTVDARLWAISRVHRFCGFPDPTRAEVVFLALRRGKRLHGRAPKQAHGLTADLLQKLLDVCPATLLGQRDRAMLRLGYDTLCRRSELVALRVEDIVRLRDGGARILVRRAKNDPLGIGHAAHVSAAAMVDVDAWLQVSGVTDGTILRPIFKTCVGERACNPRIVTQRLEALSAAARFDPREMPRLTSHSLRVGAAQDLAVAGRSLIEIMRAGRWHGLHAVALYVRKAPVNVWDTASRRGEVFGQEPTPSEADLSQVGVPAAPGAKDERLE